MTDIEQRLRELLSDASHHLSDTVSPTWTESTRVAYYERSHELLLRALEMLRKGQEVRRLSADDFDEFERVMKAPHP